MGLLKILTRRPGKSNADKRNSQVPSYEFEPPTGTGLHSKLYSNPIFIQKQVLTLFGIPAGTQDGSKGKAEVSQPVVRQKRQPSLASIISRVSLDPSVYSEAGAAAPSIPRYRSIASIDRPGTANSVDSCYQDQSAGSIRPKREPRKPPVSFRKPSSLVSISAIFHSGEKGSEAGSFVDLPRGRCGSMASMSSGRSRDLLDVQEEIKPVDFRSRVNATGARDYGEDVADRNMCQSQTGDRDGVSSPDLRTRDTAGKHTSLLPEPSAVGTRTMSLGPSGFPPHLATGHTTKIRISSPIIEMAALDELKESGSFSRRNNNRLSLSTYIPNGLPTATHFPLPPLASKYDQHSIPGLNSARWGSVDRGDKSLDEKQMGEVPSSDTSSVHRLSGASATHFSHPKGSGVRLSHQTFRSSLASSVTSRYPSGEFTPLSYPRVRNDALTDINNLSDGDNGSPRCSISNSVDESRGHPRTMSLGIPPVPSGLKNIVEIEGQTTHPRSESGRDWELTPSNEGSASSAYNPSYSESSARPQSRHTKATSIDSTHGPPSSRKSEESYRSRSHGNYGNSPGWSPATTQSTVFNIDDYVSSDDESFTTEKKAGQPTGEGEEDLLFKPSFGITGAALPGLSESINDTPSPLMQDSHSIQTTGECILEDDDDSVGPLDIEDDRVSVDRDLPMTLLRHNKSIPEAEAGTGTFGRRSRMVRQASRKTMAIAPTGVSEYFTPPTTGGEFGVYEELLAPQRGLKRLSAFGTLNGRNFLSMDNLNGKFNERNDSMTNEPIKEELEKADYVAAIRLRKESKARKRAEDSKVIQERRMTRAFGNLQSEINAFLDTQGEGEPDELERGRTRERVGRGSEVTIE